MEHAGGVGDADANVYSTGMICAICLWWLALQMLGFRFGLALDNRWR